MTQKLPLDSTFKTKKTNLFASQEDDSLSEDESLLKIKINDKNFKKDTFLDDVKAGKPMIEIVELKEAVTVRKHPQTTVTSPIASATSKI